MSRHGYELRTARSKGEGVFATRRFALGETVMVGGIDRRLNTNNPHATQVGRDEYVLLGGLSSKVNHSCDPNCGVRLNGAGGFDLIARRPIMAETEISFDYAMRNYSIDHSPPACRCGAPGCRGTVTGWKDLPAERKRAYMGHVAPYLLAMDLSKSTEPPPEGV